MKVNDLAKNAILACIYFTLTLINPIGWGMLQFRVSEVISILPFYNRKYIPGALLGVVIANMFSPLGLIDVGVGFFCGLIPYTISKFIKSPYINALIFAITCGILVGLELKIVLDLPFFLSLLSVTLSTIGTSILGIFLFEKTSLKNVINK